MRYFSVEQQTLLILLRQTLWQKSNNLPDRVDWRLLDTMAKQQGVLPLVYDAAVALKAELPDDVLEKWNKLTIASVIRNQRMLSAQKKVLMWFEEALIPAVVLKGSSVARYYPNPDLRVLGDIDILIPQTHVANVQKILLENGYALRESDHDFHLGFSKSGILLEIHYDVTHLPDCPGRECVLEETKRFLDHIDRASVLGYSFPVLDQPQQALMLLLHMVRHTIDGGIGLRQLSDWAMYMACTDVDRFVAHTAPIMKQCGLLRYAQVATAACVRYLGLSEKCASWCESVTDDDSRAFMEDVFAGGNMGDADSEKLGRALARGSVTTQGKTYIRMLIAGLSEAANNAFPATRKHKWLIPFFWIYLPIRYLLRSLFGMREKKSIFVAAQNAKHKQEYYERLALFQTKTEC